MKPVVHFRDVPTNYIHEGRCAIVIPIDHPSPHVSNTTTVATSPVVRVVDVAEEKVKKFETQNTIYVIEGYET